MQLREDVYALALPEGRVVGTPGHERARRHLASRLRELGLKPYRGHTFELPYRADSQDFCNLIALAPGRESGLAPVLIGAHYDSVIEAPCADDNAAAVAIALAAGSHFLSHPAERGVVIALFDAEEPPFYRSRTMGSIRFWEDQKRDEGIHAAIIMDLVGHEIAVPEPLAALAPGFAQALVVTGAESHPELPDIVDACRTRELPILPTLNRRVGDVSDHGIFRVNRVPYLFFSCGRWEHYHRPTDTPDRLSYAKMERIAEYLIRVTTTLAGRSLLPVSPRLGDGDTTEFELRLLRETLGDLAFRRLPLALGLKGLESAEDLDLLAYRLQETTWM